MKITIVSVGKKPRGAEEGLINEYLKRIQKQWTILWKFIPHQQGEPESAKKAESALLMSAIAENERVILLDERGRTLSNNGLAELLHSDVSQRDVSIIIGGAYGVDERVRLRADEVISLSSLVFPHRLVRIMLAEQLYRTQALVQGHPYHHS